MEQYTLRILNLVVSKLSVFLFLIFHKLAMVALFVTNPPQSNSTPFLSHPVTSRNFPCSLVIKNEGFLR